SVVGFDDIPEAAFVVPALTTVDMPMERLGRRAMELILRGLHGEGLDGVEEGLPTELRVRESTGPAPESGPTTGRGGGWWGGGSLPAPARVGGPWRPGARTGGSGPGWWTTSPKVIPGQCGGWSPSRPICAGPRRWRRRWPGARGMRSSTWRVPAW